MRSGSSKGSQEWCDRISRSNSRATTRRRSRNRVALQDVRRFRREGLVSPSMLPLAKIAEDEASAIISALGGEEAISEQERAIVEDFARVGVVLRAELGRYLAGEHDAGVKVGTLASIRRSSLVALGLGRRSHEIQLEDYIEAKRAEDKS